ncbi:hypothetical protein LXT21_01085 [Myxococcus sp. K38C18041901]|uniref:P-loop NTPase fold protein n=1 Tax=Myxococcus guangdongensis TaxID=2906760 RepID=UPI0020A7F9F7|nr:P-loop NTPase fold protein [Myxococcus guangdongensis]MCP3057365.1 hypothetical protein [Myxococcus guangdongensis]
MLRSLRRGMERLLEDAAASYDPPGAWRIVFNLPSILSGLASEAPSPEVSPPASQRAPSEAPGIASSSGSDFLLEPVAGIRSDIVDGVDLADRLNIEPDVNALCSIIAARSVEPPLAIGLFGDWGTGKSFFMSKMEKRLREICAQPSPAEDSSGKPYYFRDIAQIRFNAWHYSDGNLWASLMARLFEGLSRYGIENGRSDVEEKLRAQLRSAELVLGDAQGRIAVAQARRQQAEQHGRDVQQRQRQVEARFVQGLGSGVLVEVKKQLSEQIATRWPEFGPKELLKWHEQVHRGWGWLTELWAWVRQGGRTRAALLILGALVTTLSPWAVATLVGTESWSKVLGAVFGPLATLASWGPFVLPKVRKVVATLDDARAELGRINQQLVDEVQATLSELEQEEARAQEVAVKAGLEVERLKAELVKAHPSQRLRDFFADRDQSSDYRQHLGLISLIRNDLAALSDLLGNARDTESVGLPAVDRIVLYIDDLDRCPEDRIVQVLEAVHLLLAFPLFVVVVGVDSRWLLHALKKRYAAFSAEDAATPQAYLEKIFQIPFTLHRMEEQGFGKLIDFLLPTAQPSPEVVAVHPPAQPPLPTPNVAVAPILPSAPVRPTAPVPGPSKGVATSPTAGTPAPAPKLRPRLLHLSSDEVEVIKCTWRLIPTPRATHRLANSYRLLRVRLSESREAAFLGKGRTAEYPLVVILLATMIGFPEEFSQVLQLAKNPGATEKTWADFKKVFARTAGLEHFSHALDQLVLKQDLDALPIDSIRYWLGVVCRFSFHLRDELPEEGGQPKTASQTLTTSMVAAARDVAPEVPTSGPSIPPHAPGGKGLVPSTSKDPQSA